MSCHSATANQVRLVLDTAAYWLIHGVRAAIPPTNPLVSCEVASSTVRGDTQRLSPSGRATTPAMPWPKSDLRLSAGSRAIVERNQRAFGHGALDTALDRLMMQPERSAHPRDPARQLSPRQRSAHPRNPARQLSPSMRHRSQLCGRVSERQLNCTLPRLHAIPFSCGHTRHIQESESVR